MEQLHPVTAPFALGSTLRTTGVGTWVEGKFVWSTVTPLGVGTLELSEGDGVVHAVAWGDGAPVLFDRVPFLIGTHDASWDEPPSELRDLAAATRGMRLGSNRAVYESVAATVIGQVVTTREAKASLRSLVRTYGHEGCGPHGAVRAFPSASRLRETTPDDLHPLGIERRRAEVLIEVAHRARRIEEILDMDPDAAQGRLHAIRGIGPWTSGIVLGSAYGDTDAVAVGDYHLPNAVAWALAGEDRASDDRMLELLEPYRPQRRRVVQLIKQAGIHAPKYGPRTPVRRHL